MAGGWAIVSNNVGPYHLMWVWNPIMWVEKRRMWVGASG